MNPSFLAEVHVTVVGNMGEGDRTGKIVRFILGIADGGQKRLHILASVKSFSVEVTLRAIGFLCTVDRSPSRRGRCRTDRMSRRLLQ